MGLDSLKFYIIGIVLSAVIVTGGILFMSGFITSNPTIDPTNKTSEFNTYFDSSSNVTSSVGKLKKNVNNIGECNLGLLCYLNSMIKMVLDSARAIFTSFGFVDVMANYAASFFGIPVIFINLALLILTLLVVFAIWSLSTGRV